MGSLFDPDGVLVTKEELKESREIARTLYDMQSEHSEAIHTIEQQRQLVQSEQDAQIASIASRFEKSRLEVVNMEHLAEEISLLNAQRDLDIARCKEGFKDRFDAIKAEISRLNEAYHSACNAYLEKPFWKSYSFVQAINILPEEIRPEIVEIVVRYESDTSSVLLLFPKKTPKLAFVVRSETGGSTQGVLELCFGFFYVQRHLACHCCIDHVNFVPQIVTECQKRNVEYVVGRKFNRAGTIEGVRFYDGTDYEWLLKNHTILIPGIIDGLHLC